MDKNNLVCADVYLGEWAMGYKKKEHKQKEEPVQEKNTKKKL